MRMKSVSKSHAMHQAADNHLRTGIHAPHAGHTFTALLFGEIIHVLDSPNLDSIPLSPKQELLLLQLPDRIPQLGRPLELELLRSLTHLRL